MQLAPLRDNYSVLFVFQANKQKYQILTVEEW